MKFDLTVFTTEIAVLCESLGVARLDLFGSGATDYFREDSDLDFLVEFSPRKQRLLTRFIALQSSLSKLFNRKVELLTSNSIRNPYLRESIEKTRFNVYSS